MAVAAFHPRAAHAHMFSRIQGKRSVPAAAQPLESSAVVPSPAIVGSTSTTVMAVVITILVLVLVGLSVWRIIAWKRSKKTAAAGLVTIASEPSEKVLKDNRQVPAIVIFSEKPEAAAWEEKRNASTPVVIASWVPQTSDGRPMDLKFPEPTQQSAASRSKSMWKKLASNVTASSSSPPPAYLTSTGPKVQSQHMRLNIPPPPPAPSSALPEVPPPTPIATLKLSIPVPGADVEIASPLRSSSIRPFPTINPVSRNSAYKLPRLMAVEQIFTPSLDDELSLEAGETVHMLEEYEDEWCLCQRIGGPDAEKGVVPRFCLVERMEIVPTRKRGPSFSGPRF